VPACSGGDAAQVPDDRQVVRGLSDPMLEGMLRDRLSFRRFVGLELSNPPPDETTFVKFHHRLREPGHATTLSDAVLDHLREQEGLVLHEGTLVDVTPHQGVQGSGGRRTGLGHTEGQGATFTKKHGRACHGYKAHIATNTQGVITDHVFDTAKGHDSQHMDQLIEEEDQGVYADRGYLHQDCKQRLCLGADGGGVQLQKVLQPGETGNLRKIGVRRSQPNER